MHARRNDILVVAVFAMAACAMVVASAHWALQLLTGLLLVFFLPGYAILRAAFVRPDTGLAGAVFAVGLSMVVTTFCGFVLHFANAMTPVGWPIALGGVTIVACGIAYLRDNFGRLRHEQPMEYPVMTLRHAVMLLAAVVISAGTIMLARHQAIAKQEFAYSELWLLSQGRGSSNVTIGVRNVERNASAYDVELSLDGRTIAVRGPVQLQVGQTWTSNIPLPIIAGTSGKLEARLFKDGDSQRVYRRAWLQVGAGG